MLKTITSSSPSLPLLFKFSKSSSSTSSSSSFSRCLSIPFSKNPSSSSSFSSIRINSLFSFKNPMNNLLGKLGFASRTTPESSLDSSAIAQGPDDDLPAPGQQFAQFGAGCFWGVELTFQRVPGVTRTEVGYSQGLTHNPTYEDICTGMTNHSEVVRVQYDPKECSFESLLDVFWDRHDPTTLNRQMSSSSYQSSVEVPSICGCGVPVARRQSWTSRNPGRKFVNCKFSNPRTGSQGCGLFMWVDAPQIEWQRVIINQLLLEKKISDRQIDHMKAQVSNLDDLLNNAVKEKEALMVKNQKLEALKLKDKEPISYFSAVVVGAMTGIVMYLIMSLFG